jgi:hypothetical protein
MHSLQAWAIRNSQRAWQRHTGAIAMMKGETARSAQGRTRLLVERTSRR